jgi:hypothetical protein
MDAEMRKHLWRGLERLPVAERLDFLKWCCKQVSFGGAEVRVTHTSGRVGDVLNDLGMLQVGHGLDINTAAGELEKRLKRL